MIRNSYNWIPHHVPDTRIFFFLNQTKDIGIWWEEHKTMSMVKEITTCINQGSILIIMVSGFRDIYKAFNNLERWI